jgi:ketosteroid isomerase-like protein
MKERNFLLLPNNSFMIIKFSFALLFLLAVACQPKPLSRSEIRKILHERNEKLGEYFKAGDATQLATMYSDSAKLCPNGGDLYIGRDAIKEFWRKAMNGAKLLEMTTETITVDGNVDIIYETGKTTSKTLYQDSVYVAKVKFANVWKKQADGSYLLDVDIWNKLPE